MITSSKTSPISGEESPAMTMTALPNELVIEILTWLPGKQIGRCKCVCKLWRLIIRGSPFSETYRKRQRGMLLYWSESIKRRDEDGLYARRLHFYHCPLRRPEEPLGKFSFIRELEFGADGEALILFGATQFVNGLLCVGEQDVFGSNFRLTLHNICTGQKMSILDPLPCVQTRSTFHLGYDPVRRVYKLLRLIFRVSDGSLQGAHIMNLRPPSGPLSTWRELDYNAAGLCNLRFILHSGILIEQRGSPDDGMLCWIHTCLAQMCQRLLCFDLNRESFWFVEHPVAGSCYEMFTFNILTRAITRFNDSLVIWFSSSGDDFSVIYCYVQEDREGKKWSMRCIEFEESEGFADENSHSFSRGDMLVRNPDQSWRVYSYRRRHTQHTDKEDVLFLGRLPHEAPSLSCISQDQSWEFIELVVYGRVFSFPESNNLYRSLDDVLNGSATI